MRKKKSKKKVEAKMKEPIKVEVMPDLAVDTSEAQELDPTQNELQPSVPESEGGEKGEEPKTYRLKSPLRLSNRNRQAGEILSDADIDLLGAKDIARLISLDVIEVIE